MANNQTKDLLARERSVPAIPRSLPSDAHGALSAMRELVEKLAGKAGDSETRAVRLFELPGLIDTIMNNSSLTPGKNTTPGSGGSRILKAPRNLKYEHQIFGIKLTWENVEKNYSHVEIWCAENSTVLDDAKLVGIATKPAATWTYYGVSMRINYTFWIRAVGADGAVSPWCPPQGQGGLIVPAEIDKTIEEILNLMIGQITENQLYQALNERIALIDGTAPGSVSARIAEERTERISGDSALAQIVTTLQSTTNNNVASLQIHASVIDGLKAQYYVKTDVNGYMSGFGLYNTGQTSDFIVLANRFMVVTPGQTPKVPFVVGPIGDTGVYGVGIDGGLVVNGTIMTRHLDAGSVTAEKIGANQIGATHLMANSVTADKIAAGSITADKIAAGSITADKIKAGSITADKIAAGSITADKIKAGSIDASKITQNGVSIDKIAGGVVTSAGSGGSSMTIPAGGSMSLLFVKFKHSARLRTHKSGDEVRDNVANITINYGDGSETIESTGGSGSAMYFLSGGSKNVNVTNWLNSGSLSVVTKPPVPGFSCSMFYISIK